jgi:hypothetical protein
MCIQKLCGVILVEIIVVGNKAKEERDVILLEEM